MKCFYLKRWLLFLLLTLSINQLNAQKLVQSFIEQNIEGSSFFGNSVSGVGDVNGDGYDDVIVGASSYNLSTGRSYIYYGGSTMDNIADVIIDGETTSNYFGHSVSGAGDVNGDGYDDVIVGADVYNSYTGRSYIYYGGALMDNIADVIMTGETTLDRFGWSVSSVGDVNGDGYDDVIVGVLRYSSSTGRSYIYYGGSTMDNIADVIMDGETTNNYFGNSVSGVGDVNGDGYNDVIVGAYGYNSNTGRSYIYYGGETMDNTADIIMDGEATSNYFGKSVSGTGDVNGDGYDDVIVGAYGYNSSTGRSYIYYGGETKDNTADIIMDGEAISNYFGSVSGIGDVNGDGYNDVIVGASSYNSSTGRSYIYYGGETMDNTADIIMDGEATSNTFGKSVCGTGDINGDGYDDVIVGAYEYNSYTGRSYIYYGGETMDNTADIIMDGEATSNYFGKSVSVVGDVNGDSYDDVIVGAYGYNSDTGRSYIYYGGTSMDNIADVIMDGEATSNRFGSCVSGAGDVNGDGYNDVIVGASGYNSNTGRSYIYYGGETMDNTSDIIMDGEATSNNFGISLSGSGDVNGDGYDDVIVGASGYNSYTGRSYIYYGGSTMDNIADIIMDGEATSNLFGSSLSGSGDVNGDGYNDVIVGASSYNSNTGRSYIYYGGETMDNTADIIMDGEATSNRFGISVSGSGDVNGDGYNDVIVGASSYNSNTGRSYIYYGGETMDNTADIIMDGEATSNNFGISLSGSGDVNGDGYDDIIVGAHKYNSSAGRSYIYYGGLSMDNIADVTMDGEGSSNYFGYSVCGGGDINGDGYEDIVIGAYSYPVNGKVYIYSMDPYTEVETVNIESIMTTSVTANGTISDLGDTNPTAYGFCWNTTGTPTISDNNTDEGEVSTIGDYSSNITGLIPVTTYYIRAYATNEAGTTYGEEISFTTPKADQTITFGELATKTYGDTSFDLSATASSGLDVTYESSNTSVATISGSTVTIIGAGSTTITASQAGNETYNAADDVEQQLTINKATLTVTADDKSKTHGDANPALTVSYSGFVNSETSEVLSTAPIASCYADATTGVGTAAITVSGGVADNYCFSYVPGELAINKATLTVTADDKSKTYGDANPALTISYSGFVNSETSEVLSTAPTASCYADATTGAGTAAITVSGGVADNYSFSYVPGELTIEKATLTVTADDKSKTYGDANPALTVSYEGFVNRETSEVLSTAPTASCSADATTGSGTAAISVSGGVADNYSFSYVPGELTIEKATLTVTADNKSKTYGDANPALTVSYAGFVNSETSTVLTTTPTASCSADATTGVGTAAITVSGGVADNYSFSYVAGELTIEKATLTVTADNKSKTYGDANHALTVSYAGFVNGESTSVLTTVPTASCDATTTTGAGTAAITVSGGAADNYSFSYEAGELTINKASLTVTADDKSKTYGDANPALTVSYLGFVNGDNEDDIDAYPSTSCSADENSAVGEYVINVSLGSDDNYEFVYVNGTLTIDQSLGIESGNNFSLNVYPNPFSNYIIVDGSSNNKDIATIEIFNMRGVLIKQIKNYESGSRIHVSNLIPGSYLIKIQFSNRVYTSLIVK